MRSLEQTKLSVSDFPSFIAFSFRGYLQARSDNFRAGCVSHSSDAWNRLTSDYEILSSASGMAIEFDSLSCQHYLPQLVTVNSKLKWSEHISSIYLKQGESILGVDQEKSLELPQEST